MSGESRLEILERAVEARGRLLRVEADRAGSNVGVLALTFDVGRVLVTPAADGLLVLHAKDRSVLPAELVSLDEDEPWWRLLGNPVTAAWPGDVDVGVGARGAGAARVLKLRFREEAENPRVVVMESTGSAIRVALEG